MNKVENIDLEGYSDIGSLLKRAREEMRMSMDQASRLLHIRVRYLNALEHGRLHELPGLPYVRGYLQAYAAFLNLDKDEILRRFEDVEKQIAQRHIYFPQVFSKEKTPNRSAMWGGLGFAVLAYMVWLALMEPAHTTISMVEKVDRSPSPITYNGDIACLKEQSQYYPLCTDVEEEDTGLLPLPYQMNSILELPILPLVDDDDENTQEQQ